MAYTIDKDWLAHVLLAIKSFQWCPRPVKAIKVSQGYYELLKQFCETDADSFTGYIEPINGIPIIIDDEVATWKIEYVEDKDDV